MLGYHIPGLQYGNKEASICTCNSKVCSISQDLIDSRQFGSNWFVLTKLKCDRCMRACCARLFDGE